MKNDEKKRLLSTQNGAGNRPVRTQNRIQKNTRKCKACGAEFIARTATTLYCSSVCYQRVYYLKHKKQRSRVDELRNLPASCEDSAPTITLNAQRKRTPRINIQRGGSALLSTEVLPVAAVAERLGVCKQTIYNLEVSGRINILHLTSKLSFVRWGDILALFDQPHQIMQTEDDFSIVEKEFIEVPSTPDHPKIETVKPELVAPEEQESSAVGPWCDIDQARARYGTTAQAIYSTVHNHNIDRRKVGKKTLYSTAHLDIARKNKHPKSQTEYITILEAAKHYELSVATIHNKIKRFSIPTVRVNRKLMFLESDFRKTFKGFVSA